LQIINEEILLDMSAIHNEDKQFLIYQLKWIGVYIAIGFVISLVLPFPISLIGVLGAFIFINLIRARIMLKRLGIDMNGFFGSLSTSSSSSSSHSTHGYRLLKFYCMSCGKEHKEISCPNCGSKMKRAG
jgi:hypothetical protein